MTQSSVLIALPRDAYYQLIFTLRPLLPPISASAADIARRDHAAIAQVASLCPANAAQAALAAQYVAASAQAMECLRQTRDPEMTPEAVARCTAQAASMMRQSQSAFRLLLRAQGVKPGRTVEEGAGASWAEHCAEQWMLEALGAGGESENRELGLTDQHHETDSDTPPPLIARADDAADPDPGGPCDDARKRVAPADAGRDLSHGVEQPPTDRVHETDSSAEAEIGRMARRNPRDPDADRVEIRDVFRNQGHDPAHHDHETDLAGVRHAARPGSARMADRLMRVD
jgi:hypothetical protein